MRTSIVRANSGRADSQKLEEEGGQPLSSPVDSARLRLERYAASLIPLLTNVINTCGVQSVKYPSNAAYMLRHICLLFFLFSSVPAILHKMIHDPDHHVLDSLCLLLDGTVLQVQINTLAVIANFVETEEGARKLCANEKLLKVGWLL